MGERRKAGERKEAGLLTRTLVTSTTTAGAIITVYSSYLICIAVVFYPHTNSRSLKLLLCPFGRCQNSGFLKSKAVWLANTESQPGSQGSNSEAGLPGGHTELHVALGCSASALSLQHVLQPKPQAQASHQSIRVRTAASQALRLPREIK